MPGPRFLRRPLLATTKLTIYWESPKCCYRAKSSIAPERSRRGLWHFGKRCGAKTNCDMQNHRIGFTPFDTPWARPCCAKGAPPTRNKSIVKTWHGFLTTAGHYLAWHAVCECK